MRITFVDFIDIDYVADTPETTALGGSQSGLCYLVRALAAAGADVRMVTGTTRPGRYAGVECLSLSELAGALAGSADQVVVGLNNAERAPTLRAAAPAGSRLVLWTGHDIDQPGVTPLAEADVRGGWDAFALVSDWQRDRFVATFGLAAERIGVLRNAIAPAFEGLPVNGKAADEPPMLAYTSTPFRGLHILLHAMPRIRDASPQAGLKVFSSMSLYHADADPFEALYAWARRTPGVEYSPAVGQAALARALRDVDILAYPNTFDETSCIAVMEAMAAGCAVVTTRRGALPETTAGDARLVEPDEDARVLSTRFADAVAEELTERRCDRAAYADRIARQVARVNGTMTWARRAEEWSAWLETL